MPVTVRGTDILFNDGTTQATAYSNSVTAGTLYVNYSGQRLNSAAVTTLTKYIYDAYSFASGTVNIESAVRNNNNGSTSVATIYMRVYKNGVAYGAEVNSGSLATNTNGNCTVSSVAISPGDKIDLYFRSSTTNINWVLGPAKYGVSSFTIVALSSATII